MNCPVCNRNLVVTLSVCPACGTMMNDSVREELILKKSPVLKPREIKPKEKPYIPEKPVLRPPQKPVLNSPKIYFEDKPLVEQKPSLESKIIFEQKIMTEEKPAVKKSITAKLGVKPTSPTLVEFQHKENILPEWRLELKNAVRQKLQKNQTAEGEDLFPTPRVINRTAGATALKPEYFEETELSRPCTKIKPCETRF